jgi:hypothetical protein
MNEVEAQYVLIVFDQYDESSVSYVLGPYDTLCETQEVRREVCPIQYRKTCIQRLRAKTKLPEWEQD